MLLILMGIWVNPAREAGGGMGLRTPERVPQALCEWSAKAMPDLKKGASVTLAPFFHFVLV